jgi:hypothetical protein
VGVRPAWMEQRVGNASVNTDLLDEWDVNNTLHKVSGLPLSSFKNHLV